MGQKGVFDVVVWGGMGSLFWLCWGERGTCCECVGEKGSACCGLDGMERVFVKGVRRGGIIWSGTWAWSTRTLMFHSEIMAS